MPPAQKNLTTYQCAIRWKGFRQGTEDLLEQLILEHGCQPLQIVQQNWDGQKSLLVYWPAVQSAQKFAHWVRTLPLGQFRVRTTKIVPDDWKDKWQETLKPFWLTSEIYVVPQNEKRYSPQFFVGHR